MMPWELGVGNWEFYEISDSGKNDYRPTPGLWVKLGKELKFDNFMKVNTQNLEIQRSIWLTAIIFWKFSTNPNNLPFNGISLLTVPNQPKLFRT
jgi:hypothetical protein